MTVARPKPYVHVSWLAKLMAGSTSCHWQPWFQAHFKNFNQAPSNFNQAGWLMDHTRLLNEFASEVRAQSETMNIEKQNDFWYEFPSGLTLSGTPDIVGSSDGTATVYDVKTGQPGGAHQIQVMIYMYCLPRCFPAAYDGMTMEGCVVYPNSRVPIPSSAIDEKFKENLEYFLSIVDTDVEPPREPSEGECAFCKISSEDCPERIDAQTKAQEGVSI